MKTIKSILHSNERAYELISDWSEAWQKRGDAPLLAELLQYDTYGDGTTKHSGSWCAQFAELADVCLSLTAAILEDPKDKAWNSLTSMLHLHSVESIRFALSVQFKEGKRQYYSLKQGKVTIADKSNDRRYNQVASWYDATPNSAMSILLEDFHWDWLAKVILAYRVRDEYYKTTGNWANWHEVFKPLANFGSGDEMEIHPTIQAVECLIQALIAVESLESSRRIWECAVHNSKPAEAAA